MPLRGFLGLFALALSTCLIAIPANSQSAPTPDDGKASPAVSKAADGTDYAITPVSMDTEKLMQLWIQMGRRSKFHGRLSYFIGTWQTSWKMWMAGAGKGQPMEAPGAPR